MSATTGTPATSCASGSGHRRWSSCSSWSRSRPAPARVCEPTSVTSRRPSRSPVRQLLLAAAQVGALLVPLVVLPALAARRRWRRLGTVVVAAAVGAAVVWLVGVPLDEPPAVPGALSDETWLLSTRFPSVAYLGGAVAVGVVGKPWLGRRWRRATDVSVVALTATMARVWQRRRPGAAPRRRRGRSRRRGDPRRVGSPQPSSDAHLDRHRPQRRRGSSSRSSPSSGPWEAAPSCTVR